MVHLETSFIALHFYHDRTTIITFNVWLFKSDRAPEKHKNVVVVISIASKKQHPFGSLDWSFYFYYYLLKGATQRGRQEASLQTQDESNQERNVPGPNILA